MRGISYLIAVVGGGGGRRPVAVVHSEIAPA